MVTQRHNAASVGGAWVLRCARSIVLRAAVSVTDSEALRLTPAPQLDNARLTNLLATTREYREFINGSFAGDHTTSTGRERSSYLAEVSDADAAGMDDYLGGPAHDAMGEGPIARWDEVEAYKRHYAMDDSLELDPSCVVAARHVEGCVSHSGLWPRECRLESEKWVPSDAVKVAVQFRQQHLAHVPSSLIRA